MENLNSKPELKAAVLICNSEMNEEIEKWKCNIENGLLGMLRDICILLTKFFKNDSDIIEVSLFYFYFFFIFYFILIIVFLH
jgi:hypothetical protein